MTRSQRHSLQELARSRYDLLVLGGGINGAGVARDAAQRGLKVLLLEKQDFGFGTSSRSTKLAHGGLRYLETFEFSLVRESLRERGLLQEKLAPHLVKAQPFLIPFYQGDARPPWFVGAGLWLYDLLAFGSLIGRHRRLGRSQALEAEPLLDSEGLRGAALYYDCRMNDARLVLENILDAERQGAKCLNYVEVLEASRLEPGEVRIKARDGESGEEAEFSASLLVNASGPWADEVLGRLGRPAPAPLLKPTKGVHLLTPPLTRGHALLLPVRGEKRIFFVIPFESGGEKLSLVGTTDTDFSGDMDHVRSEAADRDYLLAEINRVFPSAKMGVESVRATYAGLRPLAAPLKGAHNSAISREAQIIESGGMLTLVGGKFTTYRAFAERAVGRAMEILGLPKQACQSAARPLPGAPKDAEETRWLEQGPEASSYLRSLYGMAARDLVQMSREDASLAGPLREGSPAILAQAVYAARREKAARLPDFYLRRTFLGLEGSEPAGAQAAARAMGRELGWSKDREALELDGLFKVLSSEYR